MKKQTESEFAYTFGRMIKGKSSLLLTEDQLSDTQNLQPGFGWKQRRGKSALTASAVAAGLRFKSMAQFRTLDGTTDCLLAHTYDSVNGERIMQASALPPSVITWAEKYDLTADCEISQWANVAEAIVLATRDDFLIWKGASSKPTGVFYYDATTGKYINYYDEMTDGDTETSMPLNSMPWEDEVVVVSEMALDTITPIIGNPNSNDTAFELFYWNGAWTQVAKNTLVNNGDLLEEDCDTFGSPPVAWTDFDPGGESTEETWNDKEVFKFDCTGGGGSRRRADVGTLSGGIRHFTYRIYFWEMQTNSRMQIFAYPGGANDFLIYLKAGVLIRYWDGGALAYTLADYLPADNPNFYNDYYDITVIVDYAAAPNITSTFYIDDILIWEDELNNHVSSGTDGWVYLDLGDVGNDVEIARYSHIQIGSATTPTGDAYLDGTRLGGVTLSQAGSFTWEPPDDEVPTTVQGIPGFAYKLKPIFPLDSATSLTGLTVHAPMDSVGNIWDGVKTFITGCYVYDGTSYKDFMAYVNNDVEAQFADLSGGTTSYRFLVGSPQRLSGVQLFLTTDGPNLQNAQIDAIYYHNATGAETAVASFDDGTLAGTSSFGQKGTISWPDPGKGNEKAVTIAGDTAAMYWYIMEWDATLTDPTQIFRVKGIPLSDPLQPPVGVIGFKRRVWQIAPRGAENSVRFSAANLPSVWNGLDSGYIFFGERPLRAGISLYNEALVFADTEIWMIKGSTPSNFGRLRLSGTIGISAAQSLVAVESGLMVEGKIKNIVAWVYADGIWLFDNSRIWKVSAPDIDSFFDPSHDDYINPDYLDQTSASYDYETQTAQFIVYSGANATTPTKVIVMHFPTMLYGIYKYGTDLSCMLPVVNNKYYTCAGGHSDGKFYLLNTGITDLDSSGNEVAVDAWATTRDMFLSLSDGMRQRLLSVWAESRAAGGLIELDEYPDGSETPQSIGKQSMTWLGKLFGAFQRTLRVSSGQKTTKFRVRNRSKNARMNLIGYSATVDRGRSEV